MTRLQTCFLAAVLLTIVVHVSAEDILGRRSHAGFDRRDRKNYERHQGYHDRSDDDYSYQSSSRRNRYPSFGSQPSSNGYSSRSRWPSSRDDAYETDDMSHHGYGMNMLSKFPGSFPSELPYHSGPTCHSLIDPQYPLFSDICGAVPQARYALPNSFGHLERWQVAQVLSTILDPAALSMSPPTCMRSLRLLLCPLLFPPCPTRFEAPPMLPCQPFCRAIKNQCAAPALDLLPCDLLPPSSDLCPMNPTPYSSLLSSFGQPSPFNSGMPPSSLASLLAQSALSQLDVSSPAFSPMFPPSLPPPAFQGSPFASPAMSSSPFSSLLSGAGLAAPTSNPLLNLESILSETLNPILVDFPPLGMMRDVRHGPQVFPMMRSATEAA